MDQICRICLQPGARFPIFQEESDVPSVKMKIYTCLHEEMEDIDGYPRSICDKCNTTLDVIYNFIETYRQTARLLEDTKNVKIEIVKAEEDYSLTDDEPLITIKGLSNTTKVKVEDNLDYDSPREDVDILEDNLSEIYDDEIRSVIGSIKNKIIKKDATRLKVPKLIIKKVKKTRKRDVNKPKTTNNIATSLLEGEFAWTGMKWRYVNKIEEPKPMLKSKLEKDKELKKKEAAKKAIVKRDKRRLCDLCGSVCGDQNKLKIHIRTVHSTITLKCDQPGCKKVCTSEKNIMLHKLRKHSKKRDFVCGICNGTFAVKTDLSKHMRVHKKDYHLNKKRFDCSICEKSFTSKKSIEIHERSVHTGDRPAVCTVCNAAFFHTDYLKEHMRLHTGETPFHCPICGRGYAQRCNMKSHMKQHRVSELNKEMLATIRPNYLKLLKY